MDRANAPASFDTGFTKDDILKRMDEDRERVRKYAYEAKDGLSLDDLHYATKI
jgi:hypothetical protein